MQYLQSFQGIIGAVGFLVAVVFGALYGRNKAALESYKESNSAYEDVVKARDLQHKTNQERITNLETKAQVLENQVTQAPSITELALQMGKQHKEMMGELSKLTRELGNIAKNIISKE